MEVMMPVLAALLPEVLAGAGAEAGAGALGGAAAAEGGAGAAGAAGAAEGGAGGGMMGGAMKFGRGALMRGAAHHALGGHGGTKVAGGVGLVHAMTSEGLGNVANSNFHAVAQPLQFGG